MDRAAVVLDRTGNTSAASIPLALADALDKGRVADGDLVLLVGFGAGMTAASAIIELGRTGCDRGERRPARSPRHRRFPGHRTRLRPPASPPTATGSPSPIERSEPPDGLFGVPVRRHVHAPTSTPPSPPSTEHFEGPVEVLVSNAGDHPRRPAPAHERRRLHRRDRRQPHRRLPRLQARGEGDAAGPRRPDHPRVLGRRPARLGRPGELRRLEGRASSGSPARSPASSDRAASPSTSSLPGRSPPT